MFPCGSSGQGNKDPAPHSAPAGPGVMDLRLILSGCSLRKLSIGGVKTKRNKTQGQSAPERKPKVVVPAKEPPPERWTHKGSQSLGRSHGRQSCDDVLAYYTVQLLTVVRSLWITLVTHPVTLLING